MTSISFAADIWNGIDALTGSIFYWVVEKGLIWLNNTFRAACRSQMSNSYYGDACWLIWLLPRLIDHFSPFALVAFLRKRFASGRQKTWQKWIFIEYSGFMFGRCTPSISLKTQRIVVYSAVSSFIDLVSRHQRLHLLTFWEPYQEVRSNKGKIMKWYQTLYLNRHTRHRRNAVPMCSIVNQLWKCRIDRKVGVDFP